MATKINNADEFWRAVGETQQEEDCSTCDDFNCPANPNRPGGARATAFNFQDLPGQVQEALRARFHAEHPGEEFNPAQLDGKVVGIDTSNMPPEVRERLEQAMGQLSQAGITDVSSHDTEDNHDGDFAAAASELVQNAKITEQIVDTLGDIKLELAKLERDIEKRSSEIHKALLDSGELGNNDIERKINMQDALESDPDLSKLLDRRAELQGKVEQGELYANSSKFVSRLHEHMVSLAMDHKELRIRVQELQAHQVEAVAPVIGRLIDAGHLDLKDVMKELNLGDTSETEAE